PIGTQNEEDTRGLIRSLLDAFPHVSLWTTDFHEMLLIGSPAPLVLDATKITERLAKPDIAEALPEVGIRSPAALLATWITDRRGLEGYVGNVPAVTDDRPSIEYGTWLRPGEFQRVLPRMIDLWTNPPLRGADPALVAAVVAERERLMTFYAAGLHAQNG